MGGGNFLNNKESAKPNRKIFSLRTKLLISYAILILIPLVTYSAFSYILVSDLSENQIISLDTQALETAATELDSLNTTIRETVQLIAANTTVFDILYRQNTDYQLMMDRAATLRDTIIYYKRLAKVDGLNLYVDNSQYGFLLSHGVNTMELAKDSSWMNYLVSSDKPEIWCYPFMFAKEESPEYQHQISLVRSTYQITDFTKRHMLIKVDVLLETITDIMDNALRTNNSVILLTTNDQVIAISSHNSNNNRALMAWAELKNTDISKFRHEKIITGGISARVSCINVGLDEWQLFSWIPEKDILETGVKMRTQMMVTSIIVIILILLFAFYMTKTNVIRINQIRQQMHTLEKGNFDIQFKNIGSDELGQLMMRFQEMAQRVEKMISERYEMGQQVKMAEFRTLQAQINPHFLYNSLDVINCLAIKNNQKDISEVTQTLSRFFRLTLSKGADLIPLGVELEHIRLYTMIQNLRFSNRINLVIDVDETLLDCLMPKLVLQPLVENAILHGILEKPGHEGNILIHGKQKDNILTLTVEDDGTGMDPEKLETLLKHVLHGKSSDDFGYGVRNTHARLQMIYGESYGLFYRSKQGFGTAVDVIIPLSINTENKHTNLNFKEERKNL